MLSTAVTAIEAILLHMDWNQLVPYILVKSDICLLSLFFCLFVCLETSQRERDIWDSNLRPACD